VSGPPPGPSAPAPSAPSPNAPSPSAAGGLTLEDVTVRFARGGRGGLGAGRGGRAAPLTAVDRLSLTVGPGEIVAVLGASGSGKSSLLRAVAGLEPLATGRITWDGEDVTALPVHRRGFVVMFQDGQLFPHKTVAGNVAFGLRGLPKDERRRRVDEWLALVGLEGFGPRPITALSGGQAQRVCLARSLAPRPRLLLLDEPLSALDRNLRERLVATLATTLRAAGTPALHVTHDQDEAFGLADRVALLDAGRLLQVDTPAALWRRPASRRVAEFLGYGPFLGPADAAALGLAPPPGRLVGLGPTALVTDPAGLPLAVVACQPRRGAVEVTVRLPQGTPARLTLADDPGPSVTVRLDPSACVVVPEGEPDGLPPAPAAELQAVPDPEPRAR